MKRAILLNGLTALFLTACFISFLSSSSAQELDWGQKIESLSGDDPRDMALDQNGNQYIAGFYDSTITIGNEGVIRNAGGVDSYNMFIGRVNNDEFARGDWLATTTNDNIDSFTAQGYFTGVAYADGNIFLASESSGDITFNNQSLTKGQEQRYLFIAKFDTTGNLINMQKVAKSYLNNRPFEFTDLVANEQGELYLSGYTISTSSDDSVMLGNEVINQNDYNQPQGNKTQFGFLMKLDQSMNAQWTEAYYSDNGDDVRFDAITYDPAGNLNVFGELNGPITDKNQTLSYSGSDDGTFLMQVNDAGVWQWWEVLNDFTLDPFATADIATSENGKIYIGAETRLNGGGTNGYFAKFNNDGSPVWEKTIGTGQTKPVSQIDVDQDNLYVGGNLKPDTISFTSQGKLIGQFDTSGKSQWYATYGDPFQANTGTGLRRMEVSNGKLFCHGVFGFRGNSNGNAFLHRVGDERILSSDYKNTMFTGGPPSGYMLRYDVGSVPCYGIKLNPDFSYKEVCKTDSVPIFDETSTNAYGDLRYKWVIKNDTFRQDTFKAIFDYDGIVPGLSFNLYVTTQSGCKDSFKSSISLLPSNTVSTFSDKSRHNDGKITFVAGAQGYQVYNWDFGDGDTIQGTLADTSVTHTYDSNKTYDVTLTTKTQPSANCSNSKTKSFTIESVDYSDDDGDDGSNVPESKAIQDLNIFPRPFDNDFEVRYELTQAANVNIDLYNSTGQQIETLADNTQTAGKHTITYNAGNDLSQGIYNLVIEIDGKPQTYQLPKVND